MRIEPAGTVACAADDCPPGCGLGHRAAVPARRRAQCDRVGATERSRQHHAAYLETAAGGGPAAVPDQERRWIQTALAHGRVVSAEASRFLLQQMQPIQEHRWGLGAVGASAFKPGWYRADTETRQMGILDGHASCSDESANASENRRLRCRRAAPVWGSQRDVRSRRGS